MASQKYYWLCKTLVMMRLMYKNPLQLDRYDKFRCHPFILDFVVITILLGIIVVHWRVFGRPIFLTSGSIAQTFFVRIDVTRKHAIHSTNFMNVLGILAAKSTLSFFVSKHTHTQYSNLPKILAASAYFSAMLFFKYFLLYKSLVNFIQKCERNEEEKKNACRCSVI